MSSLPPSPSNNQTNSVKHQQQPISTPKQGNIPRPGTPAPKTSGFASGGGSNTVQRGPGWRTKPPVKPRIQPEFWHRPFAAAAGRGDGQFTDVEEGYMIGYMDSRDIHFRKIQRKCFSVFFSIKF